MKPQNSLDNQSKFEKEVISYFLISKYNAKLLIKTV